MLIVMKKTASDEQLRNVKQHLVDNDFDFHQSTGANRTILGVIGDTDTITVANAFVHLIGYGNAGMPYPRIQASDAGAPGLTLGDAAGIGNDVAIWPY